MAIWSTEIKELERLYESLKGQLPDLDKELGRLVKADDENMILLYSRRCLEVIITDVCECELKRERGTEPLKGIIDKLHKEKKIPAHIVSSMYGLNELSTYGTHPKDFDPEQVKPVINNLLIIAKWYQKYKEYRQSSAIQDGGANISEEVVSKKEQDKKSVTTKKRPNKRIKNRVLVAVLTIIGLISVILIYINFFAKGKVNYSTSEEILNKAIRFYDFRNQWENYYGKVHLTTVTAEDKYPVNQIIEIQTKENYYKCSTILADGVEVRGIQDGKFFKGTDSIIYKGNEQIKEDERLDIQFYRGHHYMHFGSLMELKNSDLILEKRVKTIKFQGFNCLTLVFRNDTSKMRNVYFKRVDKITVYINPQDYSIRGYRETGAYNFYAVCSGLLSINGIKMPKCKTYFNNADDSFRWVDLFTTAE